MSKPKGYNEEFVEFWCEDKAEGMRKLPFWQGLKLGELEGGPAKIYWGCPIEEDTFCPVDAWELRDALPGLGDMEAIIEWAGSHQAGPDAVWPVVLAFQRREWPLAEEVRLNAI